LNHLGHTQTRLIVILNDNGMSISPNVGGYSRYFDRVRNEPMFRSGKDYLRHLVQGIPSYGDRLYHLMSKMKDSFKYLMTPGVIFEELGLRYVGPVNGHNLDELQMVMAEVKTYHRPVLLHVRTVKGKGFLPAEDTSCKGAKWHGGGPFDPSSGKFIKSGDSRPTYSQVFGSTLCDLAKSDNKVVAITAAMPDGTGLTQFAVEQPERFFDVAMAEQHAVTFAAGLCSKGYKPYVAIYSTFLQRAYDQIVHDVCLQGLPVRFCLDRGGLVGADGPTHHGAFDMAYLRCLPDMVCMAPRDEAEFQGMLSLMLGYDKGPTAIRYPRGSGPEMSWDSEFPLELGKADRVRKGQNLLIVAIGTMVAHACKVASKLAEQYHLEAEVIDARFLKPLDGDLIAEAATRIGRVVTMEEGTRIGGLGSAVMECLSEQNIVVPVLVIGLPDEFVTHGDVKLLYEHVQLDVDSICEQVSHWAAVKD